MANYEERRKNVSKWIDESIISLFYSLKETKNSHWFKNHVNKDEKFLLNRCIYKGEASTFTGNELKIINMIKDTLLQNRDEVIDYVSDDEDFAAWEIEGTIIDSITGCVYDKTGEPRQSEKFVIILGKRETNEFFIKTTYPV